MRIRVKVIPHSKVCTITEGDVLIVKLKERAEDGKANVALIKLLKKHFHAKNVTIVSGFSQRNKVLEIE